MSPRAWALGAALVVLSCAPARAPEPPGATCADACANGVILECPWAIGDNLATCTPACQNATVNALDWDTLCISRAPSCDAARACPR